MLKIKPKDAEWGGGQKLMIIDIIVLATASMSQKEEKVIGRIKIFCENQKNIITFFKNCSEF